MTTGLFTTVVGSYPQPDDCGMEYLPRELAFAKLQAMVAATKAV